MRRELIAIGLAMAMVVVGYPGADAVIDPPDLSWIQNGFTLKYHAYNTTDTLDFNVTIEDKTASQATFVYWRVNSGQNDTFHSLNISIGNRSILDISYMYTFLWVNSTDLDTENAMIGAHEYECVLCLPGANKVFFNVTTDTTFTYDAVNGYLVKADYPDGTTVELTGTEDIGQGAPASQVGPVFVCTRDHSKSDSVAFPKVGAVTTVAQAELCWDERASETNACFGEAFAQVTTTGPLWALAYYEYWVEELIAADRQEAPPAYRFLPKLLDPFTWYDDLQDSFSRDLDEWYEAHAWIEEVDGPTTDAAHAHVMVKC